MDIVVLLKQVPDTETLIEIADDKVSIKSGDVKWVVNPYDELAVEEALQIREKQGEGKITILSVGPERSVSAIRTALAMGADEGILIDDSAIEGIDALGTAKVLAAALKDIPFDLIIAGQRSVDDDNYIVPYDTVVTDGDLRPYICVCADEYIFAYLSVGMDVGRWVNPPRLFRRKEFLYNMKEIKSRVI